MEQQFKFALPPQIPPAHFIRVVMTAVQNNPKLLKCDRGSFFNACMKCAQDGLLPDGREAALVPFADDPDGGGGRSDLCQYMPMIQGIRKKVMNSKMLKDWNVQVVQEGDQFDYQLGDNPSILHKPAKHGGRTRPVLFAYSIATYNNNAKSREVMNIDQIKDIQSKSKARRGPWSDPIFFPEMCRKTVAKLHAKQLPMSTDLLDILHRDDEELDKGAAQIVKPPPSVGAALDMFAAGPDEDEAIAAAPPAQQIAQAEAPTEPPKEPPTEPPKPPPSQQQQNDDPLAVARRKGYEARTANMARKAIPGELRGPERSREAQAWQAGWDAADSAGGPTPGASGALLAAFLAVASLWAAADSSRAAPSAIAAAAAATTAASAAVSLSIGGRDHARAARAL
jgi:recombination protein RecT